MKRLEAGVAAALFRGFQHFLARAHAVALGDEILEQGVILRQ